MLVDTQTYRGHKIRIETDDDPLNPRVDYDNLGTMVCFNKRYDLGDKGHGHDDPEEFQAWLKAEAKNLIALRLYLYDHSGITMNTGGYSHCDAHGWDWGCVGILYITKAKVRKEYGWKVITKARREKIEKYLRSEVETYAQYLEGAVYGYKVDLPEEELDGSCWGYFGYDHEKSGLYESAHSAIDYHIRNKREKYFDQLKKWIRNRVPLRIRNGAPETVFA